MTAPTIPRCCAEVVLRGMAFYRTRQCSAPGKVIREGKPYCGRHDPEAMTDRAKRLEPQKQATQARNRVLWMAGERMRAKRRAE